MPTPTMPLPYGPGCLAPWQPLINFRPPAAISSQLDSRFIADWKTFATGGPSTATPSNPTVVQSIDDAHGPVNLDYYPVHIAKLPTVDGHQLTPQEFVSYVRVHLNDFVNQGNAGFEPYSPADAISLQSNNPVGAVVHIDMRMGGKWLNPDDGSVVVSESAPDHWTFSTIWTPDDQAHPVSGNREFGLRQDADGGWTFYTRGADRTTGYLDSAISSTVFSSAHELWTGLATNLATWVNQGGGVAQVGPITSERWDWDAVKSGTYVFPIEGITPYGLVSVSDDGVPHSGNPFAPLPRVIAPLLGSVTNTDDAKSSSKTALGDSSVGEAPSAAAGWAAMQAKQAGQRVVAETGRHTKRQERKGAHSAGTHGAGTHGARPPAHVPAPVPVPAPPTPFPRLVLPTPVVHVPPPFIPLPSPIIPGPPPVVPPLRPPQPPVVPPQPVPFMMPPIPEPPPFQPAPPRFQPPISVGEGSFPAQAPVQHMLPTVDGDGMIMPHIPAPVPVPVARPAAPVPAPPPPQPAVAPPPPPVMPAAAPPPLAAPAPAPQPFSPAPAAGVEIPSGPPPGTHP